ncbi:Ff.00g129470.m01.CDS01 [Fusarium sp. VM40]|nr:Ff.00g129470.m01.CDS01 [Fusarium sp. VM40]
MMAAESTALPYTNKPAPDVSAPAAILRSYDLNADSTSIRSIGPLQPIRPMTIQASTLLRRLGIEIGDKVRVSIRIVYSGLIAHAADINIGKLENAKDIAYRDLTYKKLLGCDSLLKLLFLFSNNMELGYIPNGSSLQGYVWEYDPESPGNMGAIHFVNSAANPPPTSEAITEANRSAASFTIASAPPLSRYESPQHRQLRS